MRVHFCVERVCERVSESERDRERQRETERQRDRERERERDRQRERILASTFSFGRCFRRERLCVRGGTGER